MTYVLSDIHGNGPYFASMLKQIRLQPEDTLYILGDVIDRNPDGIAILKTVMRTPNMEMLLGNHEYMMLQALDEMGWEEGRQELGGENVRRWYRNGGGVTYYYFMHQRKTVRKEIVEYLRSLPIGFRLQVGETEYRSVHAAPADWFHPMAEPEYIDKTEYSVWKRWKGDFRPDTPYRVIFGHTPTSYYQDKDPLAIWYGMRHIGIDCGCAYGKKYPDFSGRLGCLRLEDGKEFYAG